MCPCVVCDTVVLGTDTGWPCSHRCCRSSCSFSSCFSDSRRFTCTFWSIALNCISETRPFKELILCKWRKLAAHRGPVCMQTKYPSTAFTHRDGGERKGRAPPMCSPGQNRAHSPGARVNRQHTLSQASQPKACLCSSSLTQTWATARSCRKAGRSHS